MLNSSWFGMLIFLIYAFGSVQGNEALGQHGLRSGLRFYSGDVVKDNRTSLNLTPKEAYSFPSGFTLEFEANFRKGDGHYGNIFRIIGNNEINIDLISNLASESANFWLVVEDQIIFSYQWVDIPDGKFGEWMKIKFGLDTDQSTISISLNGISKEKELPRLTGLENFEIIFGACKKKQFLTTDVSPMTLNNIQLSTGGNHLFRHWKLFKHHQNKIYDELEAAEAEAINPFWLINKHINWQKSSAFQFNDLIGIAKDEGSARVFLINQEALFVCHLDNMAIDTLKYVVGQPYFCQGNPFIYNKYTDEIWSYNFNESQLSIFNLSTRKWSLLSQKECMPPDFWHHNKLISPLDSSLITFGGYGHYTYKNVINKINPESGAWENPDTINEITPRYLSAAGLLDNQNLLIYGGFGSKSGRQELSPEFYYDLFQLNLRDFSIKKLWTLDTPEQPFAGSENILVDKESNSFYTLLYNTGYFETALYLTNFKVDTPKKETFADSIPYHFTDTESFSTFFLNKKTWELNAITTHQSEVNFYSLAYPPLNKKDVFQQMPEGKANINSIITISVFSMVIIFLGIRFRKHLKRKNTAITKPDPLPSENNTRESVSMVVPPLQKRTSSALYFLGGFQVFDKNGNEITAEFTPTIRQLFLIIYLSTLKNGKGISSLGLNESLWYDKTKTSARNNRNVNISKLRNLLEKTGVFELEQKNTYWGLTLAPGGFCDYEKVLTQLETFRTSTLTTAEIIQLIQLISLGELCPNVQVEWIDNFKDSFSNIVVDFLLKISNENEEIKNDRQMLLQIATCILNFDLLNEKAITIKCSALYRLGKKSLALHSYESFCKEYKHMLGMEYGIPFNELLKKYGSPM